MLLSSKHIRLARPNKKLDHRFLGPFRVLEPIGKQAYRLALPESMGSIHPVFHVSLLEPYRQRADGDLQVSPGPLLLVDNGDRVAEEILDKRFRRGQKQYLVRWEGRLPYDNSWQHVSTLKGATALIEAFEKRYR